MSHSSKPRHSLKSNIPHDFINNWQAPRRQNRKALVRRPPTACAACRASKVRCNGTQPECSRCADRGIQCRYKPPSSSKESTPAPAAPAPPPLQYPPAATSTTAASSSVTISSAAQSSLAPPASAQPASTEAWSVVPQTVSSQGSDPEDISMDLGLDGADNFGFCHIDYEQAVDAWSLRTDEIALSGPAQMDWLSMGVTPSPTDGQASQVTSSLAIGDGTSFIRRQAPAPQKDQSPHSSNPSIEGNFGHSSASSAATTPSNNSLSQQQPASLLPVIPHQRTPTNSCMCRAGAVLLIPTAMNALRQRRTDLILKVTGDVIRSCQSIVECGVCEVKCTDLICIMSVLQHTDACFDFLAKNKSSSSIKVSVGDYEVSGFDDAKLRHMLVMNLVNKTNSLLDSISSIRHRMTLKLSATCRPALWQVNLDYIHALVQDFRAVLVSVTESLNTSVTGIASGE